MAAPDEDSFTLPPAWRQSLRPRWGSIPRYSRAPHESALDSWDRRLAAAKEAWTGTVLGRAVSGIAPEPAAAARGYPEGTADPVGAAVLAVVTDCGKLLYDVVADAWYLRHGRVFAARATVELFELAARWSRAAAERPVSSATCSLQDDVAGACVRRPSHLRRTLRRGAREPEGLPLPSPQGVFRGAGDECPSGSQFTASRQAEEQRI